MNGMPVKRFWQQIERLLIEECLSVVYGSMHTLYICMGVEFRYEALSELR
jgi:hypothetical protein